LGEIDQANNVQIDGSAFSDPMDPENSSILTQNGGICFYQFGSDRDLGIPRSLVNQQTAIEVPITASQVDVILINHGLFYLLQPCSAASAFDQSKATSLAPSTK
jgi:hypothetical protein